MARRSTQLGGRGARGLIEAQLTALERASDRVPGTPSSDLFRRAGNNLRNGFEPTTGLT